MIIQDHIMNTIRTWKLPCPKPQCKKCLDFLVVFIRTTRFSRVIRISLFEKLGSVSN